MSIPSEYQNGDITGYNLTVTPLNGNGQVQKFSLEPSLLSYNVSSLTPNAQYTISIFAKTSVGGGPASSIQISVLPKGNYVDTASSIYVSYYYEFQE